jgi:hypothetical protein
MFKAPAPQKQTQKADARQNMPNYHFYFFLVPEEIITEGLKKKKKKVMDAARNTSRADLLGWCFKKSFFGLGA